VVEIEVGWVVGRGGMLATIVLSLVGARVDMDDALEVGATNGAHPINNARSSVIHKKRTEGGRFLIFILFLCLNLS
jgi:hypothetical protein